MAKTFKKASVVLLSVFLLTVLMTGFALNASEMPPFTSPGKFDTWMGEGNISISVAISRDEFAGITFSDEDDYIGTSNYIVTGTGDSTTITFSEDYLKTLTDGTYYFDIIFFNSLGKTTERLTLGVITEPKKAIYTDFWFTFEPWTGSGASSVTIDDHLMNDISIIDTFEQLLHNGEELDPSNYTVTEVNKKTVITLKEEYLKTLTDGVYTFDAEFLELIASLKLNIETQDSNISQNPSITKDVSITSVPPSSENAASTSFLTTIQNSNTSPASPKTGEHAPVTLWLVLLSSATIGIALIVIRGKCKKTLHRQMALCDK